jgi:hypothetical protein
LFSPCGEPKVPGGVVSVVVPTINFERTVRSERVDEVGDPLGAGLEPHTNSAPAVVRKS